MSANRIRYPGQPLIVKCPKCGARKGKLCRDDAGYVQNEFHRPRIAACEEVASS